MFDISSLAEGYPMKILGLGRYVPKRVVTSEELEARFPIEPGWCKRKVGINERRWAEDESISFMCAEAIREACEKSNISMDKIDYIINAGNSFDRVMPDECVQVMKECKEFRNDIGYSSINCGCLSFVAAVDMASTLIANGKYKYILICSGILASPIVETSKSLERYTVGDAAVAMVVTHSEEGENSKVIASRMETYGEVSGVKGFNATSGSEESNLFNKDVLTSGITFEFDTAQMRNEGLRYNKGFLTRLMPISRKDIVKVIPSQSSRLVSDMLKIAFPAKKIKTIIDHFGNIGAVGHGMALYELIYSEEIKRNDILLLQAMGAGFSLYGVLLVY